MTEREALKMALEALEDLGMKHFESTGEVLYKETFAAIKEALAQPEQKPVAWSYWQSCLNDDGTQTAPWVHRLSKFQPSESIINKDITPLYTTPPQDKPDYWPLDEWSEWRDMVVVNLMRHGNIDKHFARRLAYFYQSKAPQRKPLTDKQRDAIARQAAENDWHDYKMIDAVEAAHGIKGEA